MRKVTAIFFLLLFTAGFTEAGQVLKLPLLIRHYFVHLDSGKAASMTDFLNLHYFTGHEDDGDEKQDDQLPFKTINLNTIGSVFLFSPVSAEPTLVDLSKSVKNTYCVTFISSQSLLDIFHPPRIV